jgi:hypothetical protein
MPDTLLITCKTHTRPLIPGTRGETGPTILTCPDAGCPTEIVVTQLRGSGMPASPLTSLEQQGAAHHELARSYESAGFSRSEAMQVVLAVIHAVIMKGSGSE